MALEELVQEDFIPHFTKICGKQVKACPENPGEIQADRQERVERVIMETIYSMIKH